MQAAIIAAAGQTPTYGDFADPVAAPGELRIKVAAAALSQLTRARAAGAHYSTSGGFPLVPGVDGTGLAEDGRRLYFVLPRAPFRAMAQWCVAPEAHCVAVPEGLDLAEAAALQPRHVQLGGADRTRAFGRARRC
jgi:NADPH:quinone reductase-like Zn-dependent oxidoreductase